MCQGSRCPESWVYFVDICVASMILFDPIMHEYIVEILMFATCDLIMETTGVVDIIELDIMEME